MKTKKDLSRAILLLLSAVICQCCSHADLKAQQETREISDFTRIEYSLSYHLEIKQADKAGLVIEGDKDAIDKIITKVENGTLQIYNKNHISNNDGIKIFVTVVNLEKLSLSGSGDAVFTSDLKSDNLNMEISGSGNIKIPKLTAAGVDLKVIGSGDFKVSGTVKEKLDIDVTGSGSMKAADLQAADVRVEITGSGSAEVNATVRLRTDITGSGSVLYKGSPLIDARIVGSGSTKPL
jgi:hypothetical protein